MTPPRKSNPRLEFHLKQRERIEGSPSMGEKFPRLKALTVNLGYFDAQGLTKKGEMKCKINVQQAKSMLWFACPDPGCFGGDFDLSEDLARAVAGWSKLTSGQLRCHGERKRADRELVPCEELLRYKMMLDYDRGSIEKTRTGGEGQEMAR